jgi:hypothetical protein
MAENEVFKLTNYDFINKFCKGENSYQSYLKWYDFILCQNPEETTDENEFKSEWLPKIVFVWGKWHGKGHYKCRGVNPLRGSPGEDGMI